MNLKRIFDSAIEHADQLVRLHDALLTKNRRAIRQDWKDRFQEAKLTTWPLKDGLWRSSGEHLLMVGTNQAGVSHKDFSADALLCLLRSALVLAMSAVDKVLHEAVSKHFVKLVKRGKLDALLKLELSTSYKIAMEARARRGKGGRVRARPGPRFKAAILEKLYRQSFLSLENLEKVTAACGKNKILAAFGQRSRPQRSPDRARKLWSELYERRNAVAHECDIIRKTKAKRVHFHPGTAPEFRAHVAVARSFGEFLAQELDG